MAKWELVRASVWHYEMVCQTQGCKSPYSSSGGSCDGDDDKYLNSNPLLYKPKPPRSLPSPDICRYCERPMKIIKKGEKKGGYLVCNQNASYRNVETGEYRDSDTGFPWCWSDA